MNINRFVYALSDDVTGLIGLYTSNGRAYVELLKFYNKLVENGDIAGIDLEPMQEPDPEAFYMDSWASIKKITLDKNLLEK